MHLLDRPVWDSLSSHLEPLGLGGALAKRFKRDVNLFASARDDSDEALAALADLVQPGEHVYVLQVPTIVVPPGCVAVKQAMGVQMVATRGLRSEGPFDGIRPLGDADAAEMLALARLTEPGPFLQRTHTMGRFVGVRIDGRLAAMAGERMHLPGYTEVSGVCTHPDFRGHGLARRLSAAVAVGIEDRGERAFLHAWRSNHAAIALYESLGFVLRTEVHVAVLERAAGGPAA
ncbi:MAG TPA: GNAT family N-acetyltransferase [Albitalea sp.]|uniref:GNAT family N-acetyltransferase n=1 Tax=Piscinibacter sp. TaxID=1903157 RepID=UPI002ECFB59A